MRWVCSGAEGFAFLEYRGLKAQLISADDACFAVEQLASSFLLL